MLSAFKIILTETLRMFDQSTVYTVDRSSWHIKLPITPLQHITILLLKKRFWNATRPSLILEPDAWPRTASGYAWVAYHGCYWCTKLYIWPRAAALPHQGEMLSTRLDWTGPESTNKFMSRGHMPQLLLLVHCCLSSTHTYGCWVP